MDIRDFELAELKLLVDAVQSSKFITKEKSRGYGARHHKLGTSLTAWERK